MPVPEKPVLKTIDKYPSEYAKGYAHGESDRDDDWRDWIDAAEIKEIIIKHGGINANRVFTSAIVDDFRNLLKHGGENENESA